MLPRKRVVGSPTLVCSGFAKVLGPTRVRVYRSELFAPFLPPRRVGTGDRGTSPTPVDSHTPLAGVWGQRRLTFGRKPEEADFNRHEKNAPLTKPRRDGIIKLEKLNGEGRKEVLGVSVPQFFAGVKL